MSDSGRSLISTPNINVPEKGHMDGESARAEHFDGTWKDSRPREKATRSLLPQADPTRLCLDSLLVLPPPLAWALRTHRRSWVTAT